MRFSPLSQHILNLNQIKVRAGINVNLIFGHAKIFSFVYIPWMCCPRCCFICIEESPTQRAGKWGNLCAATPQFGIPFVVCCLLPKPRNSFSLFFNQFLSVWLSVWARNPLGLPAVRTKYNRMAKCAAIFMGWLKLCA